ncbi:MAG: tyrosine-type recombinase/integrase [Nostocaceae cyanobacterium]|nr:tyrosine-type recombinase/integrase [Nostocaceae cyanobacterium]
MNFVEPIRDRKKIAQIRNQLRGQGRFRDLLLFVVGINTALRISDLLKLSIGDFVDTDGQVRQRFWIREEKRGKRQEIVINDSMVDAIKEYLVVYPEVIANPNHFAFFNLKTNQYTEPIRRGQAWKFITQIAAEVGLRGNFGTHSLRKTWGYHARLSGVDLALIMHKLNHNSLTYTKRYLGITDAELEAVVRRLNL